MKLKFKLLSLVYITRYDCLFQAAKQTAAGATQTIVAANACQPYIQSRTVTETLIIECTETAERVPPLIGSIRESQTATSISEKFRAQSNLIRDTQQVYHLAFKIGRLNENYQKKIMILTSCRRISLL